MKVKSLVLCVFLVALFSIALAIEPITMTAAAVAAASGIFSYFDRTYCRAMECCDKYSINVDGSNITALQEVLQKSLYGQHLVSDIVIRALKGHFDYPSQKALALSFHGAPGSGKTYVTQFIVESLFKKVFSSKFVKMYVAGKDFPSKEPSQVDLYRMKVQDDIRAAVKNCERSIFIFEDVSLMPPKILDGVKPFIDYHESIDGVDYRKTIFIFISNTGSPAINDKTFQMWKKGIQREDISLRDFDHLLREGAFNDEGGWFRSDAIQANLIDHYIPFLPLEERHVINCIKDTFRSMGYSVAPQEAIKAILEELTFSPDNEQLYSTSGCKRVAPKVSAYVQGQKFSAFALRH